MHIISVQKVQRNSIFFLFILQKNTKKLKFNLLFTSTAQWADDNLDNVFE